MKLLVAAVLVVILPGVQPATAESSKGTCQGRLATITCSPGVSLTGTQGPDVIISNGVQQVDAMSGSDVICVTGNANLVRVNAHDGDDIVDTTEAEGRRAVTTLHWGADTLVGGATEDFVRAGLSGEDVEVDYVDAGAGDDTLISGGTNSPWVPGSEINRDVLRGGPGDDTFRVRGVLEAPGVLRPGGPHNRLQYAISGDTAIDLRARTVTIDDRAVLTWRGGHIDHMITGGYVPNALMFSGTNGADVLTLLHPFVGNPLVAARLGSGDDRVEIPFTGFGDHSTFSAGGGQDTLVVNLQEHHDRRRVGLGGAGNVMIDLASHTFSVEEAESGIAASAVIGGFDRVRAGGSHSVVVRGDRRANTVVAVGCSVEVDGGAGGDVLRTRQLHRCTGGVRHLSGGRGNDLMMGDIRADVLVGGPGRDIANGRGGTDICRAEITRQCEN